MKKKILVIGNSIKAYSLAKKLSENYEIFTAPLNDTIKEFAQCLDIREDSVSELLEFVLENDIELTIPVSEATLKTDIVEIFTNNNRQIFAPSQRAANLSYDKTLAKKVCYKLRIPTPKFGIFEKPNMAYDYIKNQKAPFVIKTNEQSSAVVLTSTGEAKTIIDSVFAGRMQKVLIEDYVWGTPFSFYTVTDGYKALPIGSSIVYRHSLEGEGGQLTSGMGSCSPNYKLSMDNEEFLMNNVIYPVLDYLEIEGNPYIGILGVNGILTEDGRIQVLGFQSFMQDSDSDAVLNILDTDLYHLFESCVIGSFSDEVDFVNQCDKVAVSVVLHCKNNENIENAIIGLDNLDEETKISFYPSVKPNKYLEYEAQKGSVLILTSCANTVNSAVSRVYSEASEIDFKGIYYRKDIAKPCLRQL